MRERTVQVTSINSAGILAAGEEKAKHSSVPSITQLRGDLTDKATYKLNKSADHRKLLYVHAGCSLMYNPDGLVKFLAPGSAVCIEPHESWSLLLGRGQQFCLVGEWQNWNAAIPDEDLTKTQAFLINECSLVVRLLTQRVIERVDEFTEWPNFALSWFNMLIHERTFPIREFALTPTFQQGTEPIEDLLVAIKTHPENSWNLTDAAKLAGYSPFHLSRVFRSVADMGFPEFVDRCRTELAIERLLASEEQLTIISEKCGFGTPQAMRNACREYTGFLPSELRLNGDGL